MDQDKHHIKISPTSVVTVDDQEDECMIKLAEEKLYESVQIREELRRIQNRDYELMTLKDLKMKEMSLEINQLRSELRNSSMERNVQAATMRRESERKCEYAFESSEFWVNQYKSLEEEILASKKEIENLRSENKKLKLKMNGKEEKLRLFEESRDILLKANLEDIPRNIANSIVDGNISVADDESRILADFLSDLSRNKRKKRNTWQDSVCCLTLRYF